MSTDVKSNAVPNRHLNASTRPSSPPQTGITLDLPQHQRIEMTGSRVVTFYTDGAAIDISTNAHPGIKMTALQTIFESVHRDERQEPNKGEQSIIMRTIETFGSKSLCANAINTFIKDPDLQLTLTLWTRKIWKAGEPDEANQDRDATGENRDDSDVEGSECKSLFSDDSDVQEIERTGRIRPITLRPRKSAQNIPAIKSEFLKSEPPSPPSRPNRQPSPSRSLHKPRTSRSTPALRHKSTLLSLRDEYRPESKKRAHVDQMGNGGWRQEPSPKKHKSSSSIQQHAESTTGRVVQLSPTSSFVFKALESDVQGTSSDDQSRLSNSEFVASFWTQTMAELPPAVRELQPLDRLAFFFRHVEHLKKENDLLKREEAERRKSMLLMAEKIRLMNQPRS
jgi:hypothetical protein